MDETKTNFCSLAPLFLVLIIDAMGLALVLPLLGPMFTGKAAGFLPIHTNLYIRDFWYGLTAAIFCIFMLFGAPFLGDLSDQIGRKKVLLICLFGTSLALAISAIGIEIKSLLFLILGRAIAGFMCGSEAIAQAAIVDISPEQKKAKNLGLISMASCLGFVLGPALSGFIIHSRHVHWSTFAIPFWVAAILALLNGCSLITTFKETFTIRNETKIKLTKGLQIFIEAFTRKNVRKIAAIFLIAELGWALYFQFIPLYLIGLYGYDTAEISHFTVWIGTIFSLSFLLIVPIVTKHFKLTTISITSLLLAATGVAIGLITNEWVLWGSIIPSSIGGAIFYMALLTMLSDSVDKTSQGWVMGVFAAVSAISWAIGGILCGALAAINLYAPLIITVVLLLSSVIALTQTK